MATFEVDETEAGQRADVYVATKYPQFSRSALSGLFDNQHIKVNDKLAKAGQKLRQLDVVDVEDKVLKAQPKTLKLPVIYEDKDVIVINKPAGVLTHSKGALNSEPTVASFIRPKVSSSLSGNRAGIVHRLDRGTSGLIITAKNPRALAYLQKQFSSRQVVKEYLAVVEGQPPNKEALIDLPIGRNPNKPQTFKVSSLGKPAQTSYRVLKAIHKDGKLYSLLKLLPLTGRTHQLRVHLKYLGHPIVGDTVYGHGGGALLLHAVKLELRLPSGTNKKFSIKPPAQFIAFTGERSE